MTSLHRPLYRRPASRSGLSLPQVGRSPARRGSMALLLAIALPMTAGSFCPDQPQPGRGNLDRPADLAVFGAGDDTYALLPMAQRRGMRAFSLTSRAFVPAPNVYFPLSIPLGPFSDRVALDASKRSALVLDRAEGSIRVIRLGASKDPSAFRQVGGLIPVGRQASDLAVDPRGDALRVFVSSAQTGEVLELSGPADTAELQLERVWTVGPHPVALAFDADSGLLLVGDGISGELHLIDVDTATHTSLDLGGPVRRLVAGRTSFDGANPEGVVLALRQDEAAMAIVRPGQAAPLYAQLGLPDSAVDATLIGSTEAESSACAAMGQTGACSMAAVITQTGLIYIANLLVRDEGGQTWPQLVDNNGDPPALSADPNTEAQLYDPNEDSPDALSRRPRVQTELIADWGTGEIIRQAGSATYVFTWQGLLPRLRDRLGRYDASGDRLVVDDARIAEVSLDALGARVGDLVEVPVQDGCPDLLRLRVVAIDGQELTLADARSSLDCLAQSGGVHVNLRAGQQFTVATAREDEAAGLLGRVAFEQRFRARIMDITLSQAAAGLPATGAVLAVPVDDNFEPRVLDLGSRGAVPAGITTAWAGSGEQRELKLVIATTGGSSLFLVDPAIEGYIGGDLLIGGVERYE